VDLRFCEFEADGGGIFVGWTEVRGPAIGADLGGYSDCAFENPPGVCA
jgi:hypothetical protein